tara:strand:+ start:767 stop:1273 length:507 start_codon:yes stop_codon:yes gene_type:complete
MVQQMMPMDIEGTASTVASNRRQFKHIGKLKESGANVAIIFRTVPEEPNNCLVMGPKFLDDTNHNALMKAIESQEGQDAFELGTYLNRVSFPDGTNMLGFLHQGNYIKKMATKDVIVTMGTGNDGEVSLDELNKLIAKERGVKVSELAVEDPTPNQTSDAAKKKTTKK